MKTLQIFTTSAKTFFTTMKGFFIDTEVKKSVPKPLNEELVARMREFIYEAAIDDLIFDSIYKNTSLTMYSSSIGELNRWFGNEQNHNITVCVPVHMYFANLDIPLTTFFERVVELLPTLRISRQLNHDLHELVNMCEFFIGVNSGRSE